MNASGALLFNAVLHEKFAQEVIENGYLKCSVCGKEGTENASLLRKKASVAKHLKAKTDDEGSNVGCSEQMN